MSRVYPHGNNPNTNKDLFEKISIKGNIADAEVSHINLYRPTTEIKLPRKLKDKEIITLAINNEILEEGIDYKVSDDKSKIVSLTPNEPWCPNCVVKTAIIGIYIEKEEKENALTVGDNEGV